MTRRGYSRSDVATHSEGMGYRPSRPAVNVKVHCYPDPFPDAMLREVAEDCGEDPDAFVAWWRSHDDDALTEMIDGRDGYGWSYHAAGDGFEMAEQDAATIWPGYTLSIYQEGRSGGWLVVDGLPELDTWDAVMLGKWRRFERYVRALADDHPRRIAWLICANTYAAEVEEAERLAENVDRWASLAGLVPA